MPATAYPRTDRSTATRARDRMSYDRAAIHAVIDEAYHCHLAFVVDGEPRLLPTLHIRVGETLYLHGSTGSYLMLAARGDGLPVSVAITHLDALILARSQVHHSANYRSVVAHGTARLVADPATKRRVLDALLERIATGRSQDSRPPTDAELAATAVLGLPLAEASLRARTGGVVDDEADLDLPHWAGVVPVSTTLGRPEPAPGVVLPPPLLSGPA
ncbi:pyridoxamine 5'-phosphate oxidase family protein [Natronosporangium hydrolyticum]|uniref:Pyridoxamine 5'-phosphate oxidase family protein n=1 Tax=Natronosporangium hydrolyticum TaxID=2811111 RepID=A0A895YAX7_9ACTN|nr:pyridoxamine 5'-phosphate oxidase family protein [Natronosporangium hydrolyticum]